jgi:hypothetical protein
MNLPFLIKRTIINEYINCFSCNKKIEIFYAPFGDYTYAECYMCKNLFHLDYRILFDKEAIYTQFHFYYQDIFISDFFKIIKENNNIYFSTENIPKHISSLKEIESFYLNLDKYYYKLISNVIFI